MNVEPKHSPLPWRVRGPDVDGRGWPLVVDASGEPVMDSDPHDAYPVSAKAIPFIVEAANAHHALTAQVAQQRDWLARFESDSDAYQLGRDAERGAVMADVESAYANAVERVKGRDRLTDNPIMFAGVILAVVTGAAKTRGQAARLPLDEMRRENERLRDTLRLIDAMAEQAHIMPSASIPMIGQTAREALREDKPDAS